ncbi:NAD(+) diphosphatase [Defluviimonas sp. WL0024]|uniref:NAD(+) diphosphatase n=1 Tax=Albidovulum salinarum TaxID=2984153 RepID=A0ABT2X8B1_9RHOB|nr:NAD(+) diphosphatase [Defluviimonas sp. WL0024]MCU9850188.1 NAD(+) diphosphatase [Defluviimonas sp. WL0024]
MRLAETVTFGGAGLDRAAGLRGDPEAVAAHLCAGETRILPVWRGKPLFAGNAAGWLPPGHAVLAEAAEAPVLLGLEGGAARFAVDVSGWEPPAGEAPAEGVFFDPTEQRHPALPGDHRFAELRGLMAELAAGDAELVATAKALLGWHRSHRFCSACGRPSAVIEAGWQRRCPDCGTRHFPRTDPVVIMLVTRGERTLLGRSPGWPEGMYSCLAGFMEPGETIEAAVRREVAEETGVRIGRVSYLASQPWPYPSSLMIGCLAEAESEAITLDPVELEAAVWIGREEAARVLAGDHPTIRRPRRGAIAGFLLTHWVADRLD